MVSGSGLAREAPSWWTALATEPALFVLVVAGLAGFVVVAVLLRLRRSVRAARARGALADWVLGAEDALAGALPTARERLQRVLQQDAENHGARTLLAEVLLLLGEPAAAHEHLVTLRRAFGVDNRRLGWNVVKALSAAGRTAEAAEALAAMPRAGDPAEALHRRLAIELAAGLPEEAVRTGKLLLPRSGGAAKVRVAVAHAFTTLRRVREQRGDTAGAEAAAREAAGLLGAAPAAPAAAAVTGRPVALVAAGTAAAAPLVPAADGNALPSHRPFAVLAEAAREVIVAPWTCATCGIAVARVQPRCPYCASAAEPVAREPALHRELASAAAASDEIEANEAHLQRLIERCVIGEVEAVDELVESGPAAVPIVFRRALVTPAARNALLGVLEAMGSGVLDALLRAYAQLRGDSSVPAAARACAPDLVGRVVRTFGRAALPTFEGFLDTDDRDLRKIVVDFYLGLDDPEALVAVLDRYPPVEVIHRLNATPAERLQAWLRQMPSHGFVIEFLLVNPMFVRDRDVLLAAARAESPDALLSVLARRGPSHDLATFAVGQLAEDGVAEVAQGLLRGYGAAAADALLASYLDLDRPAAARARARELLAGLGPGIAIKACQCLGASPARLDDEIVSLLVAFGEAAVDELRDVYCRRNLLERVGGRLVRRYNHPRNTIAKVLARIGGERARTALLALRADETDPNLKLRLDQALQVVARVPRLPDAGAAEPDRQRRGSKDEVG